MVWSHFADTDIGAMECVPLEPGRFADLETVFGDRGVARRCFCMYWRRRRLRRRSIATASPTLPPPPPGLVGYVNDDPKGWVQVGPRSDFPTLDRSRLLKPVDDLDPWTINCFVVRAGERRQGIGRGLLEAAIRYAVDQGAEVIEAYPVDGPRSSGADYFTGTMGMFAEHGFAEVLRRNDTRPIVRLTPQA